MCIINTNTRINTKSSLFGAVLTFIFVVFLNTLLFSQSKEYIGIEGGFGTRSFTIASNIPQIDQLTTIKAGGSIGFIYGRSIFKFPIVMGLYSQSVDEKRTIDLFTLSAGLNMAILPFIGIKKSPVNIYPLANIEYQGFAFMGSYVKSPDDRPRKQMFGEPLLGRKRMVNANLGVGVAVTLRDDFNFIYLFFEAKKSYSLTSSSSTVFNDTTITNNLAFNIGVRIGTVR